METETFRGGWSREQRQTAAVFYLGLVNVLQFVLVSTEERSWKHMQVSFP